MKNLKRIPTHFITNLKLKARPIHIKFYITRKDIEQAIYFLIEDIDHSVDFLCNDEDLIDGYCFNLKTLSKSSITRAIYKIKKDYGNSFVACMMPHYLYPKNKVAELGMKYFPEYYN